MPIPVYLRACAAAAIVTLLAVGATLAGCSTAHAASCALIENGLSTNPAAPSANAPVTASVTVHCSSGSITLQAITVLAKNSAGTIFDFRGAETNWHVTTAQRTHTTAALTLAAGTYSYYGSYELSNLWHALPASSLTVTAPPPPTGCPSDPVGQPVGQWHSAFCDGFDGTAVDTAKWNTNWFGAPGAVTRPVSSLETECYDPAQLGEGNGEMDITAIASSCTVGGTTYNFRSGIITSNGLFSFTNGYAEARLWTPGGGAQTGPWPAWFTDGQNWPTDGEIDVLEAYGSDDTSTGHYHYAGCGGDCNPGFQTTVAGATTGWHTYAVKWDAAQITWFYDGVQAFQTPTQTQSPMYLILNLGLNTQTPPVPATLRADYISVWQ